MKQIRFWVYFLFFLLWFLLLLSGCALLVPPSEEELRRWVMTEDGIDGIIISESFRKNHVVNETSGRFIICTKEGQQLRALAFLSRANGFRIFKSGTGVPCTKSSAAAGMDKNHLACGFCYNTHMLSRKDFKKAPNSPGIYFFSAKGGKILYIGKAANLRLRLLSYADVKTLSPAKQQMVTEATKVEWKECESEIEALIEEASAIKRYRPRYNVVFRDDKQYLFVGFSKEKFPKITVTHQKKKDFEYIGPFTEAVSLRLVLNSLRKIFPYCTCKEKHKRPCVRAEIGRCLGFCCLKNVEHSMFDIKKYRKNIRAIKNILRGRRWDVLKTLEKEMRECSRKQNFEEARKVRDQIFALENVFKHAPIIRRELNSERQKALILVKELLALADIPHRIEGYDISNLQGKNAVGSMVVFWDGAPKKEDYRLFKIRYKKTPDDIAMLQEVLLRRLKHDEWPLPDLFLIDGGLGQLNATRRVLDLYQLKIPVVSLAKKEEELWISPKKKLLLKRLSPAVLYLFQHIRNEAHRFAITFHRKRRLTEIYK